VLPHGGNAAMNDSGSYRKTWHYLRNTLVFFGRNFGVGRKAVPLTLRSGPKCAKGILPVLGHGRDGHGTSM
jgi:hypothetical protein